MALTNSQILEIINDTAKSLGFDFVVTEDNLDAVPLTQPEQVNRFIDALNPIIHNKIMDNFGNRGFLSRFINKQKGGSTSRHISFGVDNTSIIPSPNTLEGLVGTYGYKDNITVSSINLTVSPNVTVNTRELAKVFTARDMMVYIGTIESQLRNMILNNVLQKIMETVRDSKKVVTLNRAISKFDEKESTESVISFHQHAYSGTFLNAYPLRGNFVVNNFFVPSNVDRSLTPYEYIYLADAGNTYWYTGLHFHPEGIERYVVQNIFSGLLNGYRCEFLIPVNSIIIEEYNRYTETQDVPNSPGMKNLFFVSDFSVSIDFAYPIFRYINTNVSPVN